MKIKKITALILALCLLLCSACGSGEAPAEPSESPTPAPSPSAAPEKADIAQDNLGYEVGKTMPDFSFTTYDGREMSLYAALAEKELVLVNIWATWCSPCGMEFPYMEEAYQQYRDSVEIFALSCESADSDEKLAKYVEENGMSFPVGRDSAGLAATFAVMSIPTTIIIDRYGTICSIESGAVTSTEGFTTVFEAYTGEDYAGYTAPETAPVCDVEPSDEAELAEALNADGSISFRNVDSEHVWPFVVTERDGRSVAESSNAGINSAPAGLIANFSCEAGQVLRIDFALSCEEAGDLMSIYLDGALVKSFGGEKAWMSYAFTVEGSGEHSLVISYGKDSYGSGGEDRLWLDDLTLLSGAEAESALRDNPRYIWGETTDLTVVNPGAKEIIIDDPQQALLSSGAEELFSFWIVPDGEAQLLLTLAEGEDPERLLFFSDYDGSYASVLSRAAQSGYGFDTPVDSLATSGYPYTTVYVQDTATPSLFRAAVCFLDEENLESFLGQLVDGEGNPLVTWSYADGSEKAAPTEVSYTVRYSDQSGSGVPGVTLQVCDDSLCQIYVSDENGECRFTLPPYAYELHTLKLPEGYSGDTESVTIAPADGGEVEFTLTKE